MIKILSASYENKIHRVDNPFNENSKNIFFAREALISGDRRPEKFMGKWPKNRETYRYVS